MHIAILPTPESIVNQYLGTNLSPPENKYVSIETNSNGGYELKEKKLEQIGAESDMQ
ncbi:MAG: hypothetical protein JSR46_06315, partial [Verrucomicrobia bacterium]|nr:hypothetical protein [Verrucomicrobiota bacterium]